MKQTGHRSVTVVRRYIRDAEPFDDNAAAGIAECEQTWAAPCPAALARHPVVLDIAVSARRKAATTRRSRRDSAAAPRRRCLAVARELGLARR
jgi:hypothetical protein